MPGHLPKWFWLLIFVNLLGLILFFMSDAPAIAKPTACASRTAAVHPTP